MYLAGYPLPTPHLEAVGVLAGREELGEHGQRGAEDVDVRLRLAPEQVGERPHAVAKHGGGGRLQDVLEQAAQRLVIVGG